MIKVLVFLFSMTGCAKGHDETEPKADDRVGDLKALYAVKSERAAAVRDIETGWLARNDGDGMLWAGKYAVSQGDGIVKIEAAETEPGKFIRHPPPFDGKNDWSRDMGIGGFLPWAFEKGRLDVMQRHAAYGKANGWMMGAGDDRNFYTPQMRGILFKAIAALGGETDPQALWPSIWAAGLTDYQAHLQVMEIWLQGEIAAKANEADALPKKPDAPVMTMDDGEWKVKDGALSLLEVSETMYQRLEEHAVAEPNSALYSFVLGKYTGDQTHTLDLLLDPAMPAGTYLRCDDLEQCQLADWLFITHLLLRDLGRVD